MKSKITFHIGMEKTGTFSFQTFCTKHVGLLKRHAVFYPTKSLAFGERNHAPLVACYLDYDDFTVRSSGKPRATVLRSLRQEIDEAGDRDILISAEHFSSRFREREILQLAADFSEFDCRIAIVVREHRSRLFSAYDQAVRSGRHMTLEAFCDEVLHPSNPYLRCATTIGWWEAVFGRENITILRHSPDADIVPVLCRALVSRDFTLPTVEPKRENLSIGPRATEWLRRANNAAGRVPGTSRPAVLRALQGARRSFVKLARKFNRDGARWQLSEQDVRRLNEIAAADDAWLRTRYGIRLCSPD